MKNYMRWDYCIPSQIMCDKPRNNENISILFLLKPHSKHLVLCSPFFIELTKNITSAVTNYVSKVKYEYDNTLLETFLNNFGGTFVNKEQLIQTKSQNEQLSISEIGRLTAFLPSDNSKSNSANLSLISSGNFDISTHKSAIVKHTLFHTKQIKLTTKVQCTIVTSSHLEFWIFSVRDQLPTYYTEVAT